DGHAEQDDSGLEEQESPAEQDRRQLDGIGLGQRRRLSDIELGRRIRLAVLDELVDQLADGSFFGGVGPARLRRRRLEHQLLRLRPLLPPSLSSAPRPVLISRAKAKPTITAPASATPGL